LSRFTVEAESRTNSISSFAETSREVQLETGAFARCAELIVGLFPAPIIEDPDRFRSITADPETSPIRNQELIVPANGITTNPLDPVEGTELPPSIVIPNA
jgi:hypothetical protein